MSAMPTQYLLNPAGWMCSACSISPAGERVFPSRLSSMMTSPSNEHPHLVDTLEKHSPVSMVRHSVRRRLTSVMRRKRFRTWGGKAFRHVMRMGPDEVRIRHDVLTGTGPGNAFLVRTPTIVFILDFQERRARVFVHAQTNLLPCLATSLVLGEHVTVGGVEIAGVIGYVT